MIRPPTVWFALTERAPERRPDAKIARLQPGQLLQLRLRPSRSASTALLGPIPRLRGLLSINLQSNTPTFHDRDQYATRHLTLFIILWKPVHIAVE
jgi:hypothetical protein